MIGKRREARRGQIADTARLTASENAHTRDANSTAPDVFIGRVIDSRYQVLSRIARGGMATVYAGRDERLDRPIAIKIMHPHLAEAADLVARFRREARATARLSNPAIVAVYDQGIIDGCGYLVMELVPGSNLRQELRLRGSYSLGEALSIVEQILTALDVAHSNGLIHRDIKPENVLTTPQGEMKVADFGLARAISDVTIASTGSVLGTVAYLAPEVITGGNADDRTDLYSVGIMLYELICGKLPFPGSVPINVAYAHVHGTIPSLHERYRWIPQQIDTLIGCLAATNPDERPLDASGAIQLVQTVRSSIPVEVLAKRVPVKPTLTLEQLQETKVGATQPIDFGYGTAALPTDAVSRRHEKLQKSRTWAFIAATALIVALLVGIPTWFYTLGPGASVAIPDLVGISLPQARKIATAEDLRVVVEERHDDNIAAGTVIETRPRIGEKVRKDSTIRLVVSLGVLEVTVPNVVGQNEAAAKSLLRNANLGLSPTTSVYSDTVAKGLVISTTPAAGTIVRHDTAVNLVVSLGKQPVQVPAIVGHRASDAATQLSNLGLKTKTTEEFSDTIPKGTVISQQPAAGTNLAKGDSVSFVVSKGPEKRELPDLQGESIAAAKATLEEMGFKVEVKERGLGLVPSRVYSQSPEPGIVAKVGTTVILYYI